VEKVPREAEIVVDNLTVLSRSNQCQYLDRLRRGRSVFANDVWHVAGFPLATANIAGLAINTLFAQPWLNGPPLNLRNIAFHVPGVGGAGSVMRVGIYAADEARIYPTTLIVDSGSIDTTVATFKNTPINVALDLGTLYFFVSLIGVAAPTIVCGNTWIPTMGWSVNFAANGNGWNVAQAFGALPAVFPAGATLMTSTFPLVGVLPG
jgi:hypothetical protein